MHAETRRDDEIRHLLIDFGFTPEALNNNLALLGLKPGDHRCHGAEPRPLRSFWAALAGFLKANAGQLKAEPALLRRRRGLLLRAAMDGAASQGRLRRHRPRRARRGQCQGDGDTAASPRWSATTASPQAGSRTQSFEKLKSPSAMKLGMSHKLRLRCERVLPTPTVRKVSLPDQFDHEIRHRLQPEGQGARRPHLMQPSRRRQRRAASAGGVWRQEGARDHRRLSSCALPHPPEDMSSRRSMP